MNLRLRTWLLLGAGLLPVSGPAEVAITYRLPVAERVSLAVYDAQDVLVRTLRSAETQVAGKQSVNWDGLDLNGKPVPAGQYTWKLLGSQGLQAEYLLNLGVSSGVHHWPGNHGGPQAVAVANGEFYMSASGEVVPALAKMALDGTFRYAVPAWKPWNSLVDLAATASRLYALDQNGTFYVVDGRNGQRLKESRFDLPVATVAGPGVTTQAVATVEAEVPGGRYVARVHYGDPAQASGGIAVQWGDARSDLPARAAGAPGVEFAPQSWNSPQPGSPAKGKLRLTLTSAHAGKNWAVQQVDFLAVPGRVAADAGQVVLGYGQAVAWIDPDQGKEIERVPCAGVTDLAVAGTNRVLVLSGNKLLAVTRGGAAPVVVTEQLVNPQRLTVDPVSGDVLIVEGAPNQQIVRLAADGRLLRRYGRAGGRLEGRYDANDFRDVSDIAADGQGGFVITEGLSAPRRTAWFNGAGQLQREWYGGQLFFTYMAVDPQNHGLVWFDSQWGWVIQAEVDYVQRTWKVRATYQSASKGSIPGGWQVRHHGDQTFLVRCQANPAVLRVDEAGHRLVPVMISAANFGHYWAEVTPPEIRAMFGEHKPGSQRFFLWSDTNGDGLIQTNEVKFSSWATWSPTAWTVDDEFAVQRCWKMDNGGGVHEVAQLRPTSWSANGPRYDGLDEASRVRLAAVPGGARDVLHAADGSYYVALLGGGDGYISDGVNGMGYNPTWPANLSDGAALAKFSPTGQLLWRVGTKARDMGRHPGQLYDPMRLGGIVHDCLAVGDRIGEPCGFWTTDGLYVGSAFDSHVADGLPERMYHWWRAPGAPDDDYEKSLSPINYDMLMGATVVAEGNDSALLFASGWNSVPVYRIRGWDKFQRQTGTVKLRAPAVVAAGTGRGLTAEYFTDLNLTGTAVVAQVDGRVWFDKGHKWPATELIKKPFAVRWSGEVEPAFSESYTFGFYVSGPARLWVDGRLVIDGTAGGPTRAFSSPVPLQAGRKVALVMEFVAAKPGDAQAHLFWESPTRAIEHIPATALYPVELTAAATVSVSATGATAFVVRRTGPSREELTVAYGTCGTARPGVDYEKLPGVVRFRRGELAPRIQVKPLPTPDTNAAPRVLTVRLGSTGSYRPDGAGVASVALAPTGRQMVAWETFNDGLLGADWGKSVRLVNRAAGDQAVEVAGSDAWSVWKLPEPVTGDFQFAADVFCASDKMFPVQFRDSTGREVASIYCHNQADATSLQPGNHPMSGFKALTIGQWARLVVVRVGDEWRITVTSAAGRSQTWSAPASRQPVAAVAFGVAWGSARWDNLALSR